MTGENSILHAYKISPEGHGKLIDVQDANIIKDTKETLWVHMCALNPDTRQWLEESVALDSVVIDAMLATETRPRILVRKNGFMVILRGMNLNQGADPEDMISIRVWIDKNWIITTRRRDIKAIEDIVKLLNKNEGPKNTMGFLTMVTNRLFARMEPIFEDLEDIISAAEERIAHGSNEEIMEDAVVVRKRTAIFTRYVVPQKIVLEGLLKAKFSWISDYHQEQLTENLDRVTRYVEELYELRDRAQILNEEINTAHSLRLNETTYIFSVAATIFLPLGFLTGLMGINIGGMPGIESNDAFWIFTGLCSFIVLMQVIIFKKKKWF